MRLLLARCDAVVALWGAAADFLCQDFGVSESLVRVIPQGTPSGRFGPADAARRARTKGDLGLGSAPVVGYVGALGREKDVQGVLEAVSTLDDVTLLIAGDGPERTRLEDRAASLIPGRVRFLGTVADTRVVLDACDVLVLASVTEGMPGVLIEAAMSGVPIVATDVGGVSEIVTQDVGLLVPPQDTTALSAAIATALDRRDDDRIARLTDRFDLSIVADAWASLLEDVAGRRTKVPAGLTREIRAEQRGLN